MLRQFSRQTVGFMRAVAKRDISRVVLASQQQSQNNRSDGSRFNFLLGALPLAAVLAVNEVFSKKADNCGIVGTYAVVSRLLQHNLPICQIQVSLVPTMPVNFCWTVCSFFVIEDMILQELPQFLKTEQS